MILEDMLKYKGVQKAPKDFEKFWEKEKESLSEIDLNLDLKESQNINFKGFKCYDLHFDSINQTKIYAKCVLPSKLKENEKIPVILLFHGYGGNSGSYYDKLAFASQGYAVIAMDARGQYGSSADYSVYNGMSQTGFVVRGLIDYNPAKLYFHHLFLDTVQLVRAVKELNFTDVNQVYVFGGSMGGALATVTAALNAKYVKKAFIGQPFLCDLKRMESSDFPSVYADLKAFIRTYAQDEENREKMWETLSYIDIKNFGEFIKAKVKFYIGLEDTICYPITQFSLYNNIQSYKDLKCYSNYGHEDLPGAVDEAIMFFNE